MILKTPKISNEIRKYLNSESYRDRPLKKNYPIFEECFILLHPFLKIKNGSENSIKFETGKWPNKNQINEHCEKLSWAKFLELSKIKDYKSLDRALAFYHRAYRIGEKNEYLKLRRTIEKDRVDIIPPQVDELPEILENDILKFIKQLGYTQLYFYSDIDERNKLESIDKQIENPERLRSHIRIETPDERILIAQDFDQRFSYIFGEKEFIINIVKSLDLEGFYCDDDTSESWSFETIAENEKMNWDEDMNTEI